jgi:F0F1-type ATP synthase assembly protein I
VTTPRPTPRGTGRWVTVGGVGVLCGLLLGWLLYSLTASVPAAVVVGAAVAAILLGLAVGGVRQSKDFAKTPDRLEEARARQQKVHEAMERTRRERQ